MDRTSLLILNILNNLSKILCILSASFHVYILFFGVSRECLSI
eukprot:06044.XXX_211464_211592_1 [CDS] Oithona nana genome sequencing.